MQTFYGMSMPFYEFKGERNDLNGWAAEKGKENIEQYWKERKQTSIDGLPRHILE